MPKTSHRCVVCGMVFSSKALLQNHFTTEHITRDFECSICLLKFPDFSKLSRHINAHVTDGHFCIICSRYQRCFVCNTKFQLYIHLTVFHMYDGTASCNLCARKFSRVQNLRLHYKKKHSDSLQSLEQKAELFCGIHSRGVDPNADLSLNSVLNGDTNSDHSEAVENVASNNQELRDSARYVCSNLNELLKSKRITERDYMTVAQELPVHPKEGIHSVMPQVNQPGSVRVPLRQLDVLDPARDLNKTNPKQYTSGTDRFGFNIQINTQPDSIPDNRYVFDYEEESVEGRLMYICNVCGIPFEDLDSFYKAHLPMDSYFETGP